MRYYIWSGGLCERSADDLDRAKNIAMELVSQDGTPEAYVVDEHECIVFVHTNPQSEPMEAEYELAV